LTEFRVEVNGQERDCSFVLISKVRNYGGDFEIARNVSLMDDEFEAVLLEGRSTLRYVKYLAGMVLNRLDRMTGVSVVRTDRVVLRAAEGSPVYVQIDGEFAGRLPAEVRIVPDALTLLVPEEYRQRRPSANEAV
jgi:diacylglycerol kinase family enzyme